MFQSAGLQLPIEETTISFDNSIAYTLENVKGFSSNLFKNYNNASKPGELDGEDFVSSVAEIKRLLDSFKDIISVNEEMVDMIRFFEYAGDLIYDSQIWDEFQCDKEYLKDTDETSRLSWLLQNARKAVDELSAKTNFPERNNNESFGK